jgi:predicted transcriptional regulator
MKTAAIPSLRVTPELRAAAVSLLTEGETLSSFVEQSIRESVERRRARQAFLARGMDSREEALRTGEYYPAEQIHAELDALLREAESGAAK